MKRMITVAALAVCLAVGAAHSLKADVKSDEKGLVKFEGALGKVVSIFGGKAAREGVKTTVAVKGDRKISLNDATGQIVDLKEEKIYDLDIKKKSYKVTTFAELRQQLEDAKRRAQEEAKKAQADAPAQKPQTTSKPTEPQYDIDFDLKETGQTKTINGFNTREIVMTITMREKGKTIEQSGGMVLTSDIWMGAKIPAMKEVLDFDIRYAKAIAGPIVAGASPDEMASAMAMYPMMKDAMSRMRTENVKMDGTAIQTVTTIDAVKSEEQVAAEQKQQQEAASSGSSSSSGKGIGGLIGGMAARKMRGNSAQQAASAKATVATITNEVLKVSTTVDASELAVPAGFKLAK